MKKINYWRNLYRFKLVLQKSNLPSKLYKNYVALYKDLYNTGMGHTEILLTVIDTLKNPTPIIKL